MQDLSSELLDGQEFGPEFLSNEFKLVSQFTEINELEPRKLFRSRTRFL